MIEAIVGIMVVVVSWSAYWVGKFVGAKEAFDKIEELRK